MTRKSLPFVGLLALVVLTTCLRLAGIGFLLPQWSEPDAQLVQHLRFSRHEAADEESGYANAYPYVIPYLLRALPSPAADGERAETLDEHLAACATVYLDTRKVIALLSVLAVPLTFFLARRFVSDAWALLAAALAGASFLCQWFAQEARPHAAASAFFLCAVVAALRLRSRPSWSSYALAGAGAALAVGALHSGVVVLLSGLVAHFTRVGPRSARDHLKLALPLALVALGLVLFYPFFFPWSDAARQTSVGQSGGAVQFGRHAIALDQFTFQGAAVIWRTLTHYEPVLVVGLALAVGAALSVRRAGSERSPASRADALVVLAYVVPYTLAIAAFDETFERFVTPLVPYVALAVSCGLARFASAARPGLPRFAVACAVVLLTIESAGSARLAWLRAQPDTMELAAKFVEQNVPADVPLILSAQLELPLARDRDGLFAPGQRRRFTRWAKYQANRRGAALPPPHWTVRSLSASLESGFSTADAIAEDPLGFLRKLGPGVYVYHYDAAGGHPAEARIYEALRAKGRLLFRSSHAEGERWTDAPLGFQDPLGDFTPPFPRVFTSTPIGPRIEIYRIDAW